MPDLDGDAVRPRDLSDLSGLMFSLRKFNWIGVVRLRAGGQVLGKVVSCGQVVRLVQVFLIGLASGPEAHSHGLRTASYLLL